MGAGLLVVLLSTAASAQDLTPADKARIERVNLLQQIHALATENARLQERERERLLRDEIARVKTEIENAHPGFEWNPETGKFTPKPATKGPDDLR
jgi:hypothetical protein